MIAAAKGIVKAYKEERKTGSFIKITGKIEG
jgi:hypothetical protein